MVRPGYKQTGVGVIPEDWDVFQLHQICSMKSGSTITNASINKSSKYPCYGGNGRRGYTNTFTHDGGYALIGRQGALCGNVVGVRGKFFASEHAVVVTPSLQTDIEWLTFVLGDMQLNQYAEASAQPGLSVVKLLLLPIASPPTKAEQQAIAGALSDVDGLIGSLEQLIAKKRAIKTGTMQQLLTGKQRLPGFELMDGYKQTEIGKIPEDWSAKAVSTFGDVVTGGTPSTVEKTYWNGPYAWITPTDISLKRDMYTAERCITEKGLKAIRSLPPNTVLVTCIASIGKNAILKTRGACNQQINALIPNSAHDAIFLYYVFENAKAYLLANAGTTATSIISKALFATLQFPVPASLSEQQAIATVLSDMDAEIQTLETKLAKTKAIKQGMMSELLTGKTRLINRSSGELKVESGE